MRATFYYPWFPETWGDGTIWHPSIGRYSSTLGVIQAHVAMMEYAKCKAAIASWWGPDSPYSARIDDCLKAAEGTRFRWGLYYEPEGYSNPSVDMLDTHLTYAQVRWTNHPNFLLRGGKPVVFVYADAADQAAMAERWAQANKGRFHICLKVFSGFQNVASKPDSWHQYAPANNVADLSPYCYSVSPGFGMVNQPVRLQRDEARFKFDVGRMVDSGAYWHLVTTFNEWGEGTAVEPAEEWGSRYLDILAEVR